MVGKFQLTGKRKAWIEDSPLGPPSSCSKFQNRSAWANNLWGQGKGDLHPWWETLASWNKGKPIAFGGAEVPCLFPQRLKIPSDNNAHCQKEGNWGARLECLCAETWPQTHLAYAATAREFLQIPTSFFLFLVLERALPLRQGRFLPGRVIFSIFLFSIFISVCASSPHHMLLLLLRQKHLLRGTDLSRLSMVTAGICDYLMGLADYEKACFTVGFLRKEKWAGGCLDLG